MFLLILFIVILAQHKKNLQNNPITPFLLGDSNTEKKNNFNMACTVPKAIELFDNKSLKFLLLCIKKKDLFMKSTKP